MSLTVVIPVRDDPAVVSCVRSIDDGTPALLVFNGSTPSFVDRVTERLAGEKVSIERLPAPNLAHALQHGIEVAPTEDVLLMDSDCTFQPGSLEAVRRALEDGDPLQNVYKGRIEFAEGSRLSSRVIARTRRQHTGSRLCAYKPPLALSKRIAVRIGGYFFDRRLRWKEDADLDRRIWRAGIAVVPVPGCVIAHGPLTIAADLRSNFRYGAGAAIADHLRIELTKPHRSVSESLRRDGVAAAAYMACANGVRTLGYVSTRLRLARGGSLGEP